MHDTPIIEKVDSSGFDGEDYAPSSPTGGDDKYCSLQDLKILADIGKKI